MGRKKKVESDDEEQSARFIEAAEQIREEGAEEKFEEAMTHIVKAKRPEYETTQKAVK